MSEPSATYACDKCRARKIACSREISGCQFCKEERTICVYSRSGVIPRPNRKRKRKLLDKNIAFEGNPDCTSSPRTDGVKLQSHLATDIEVTEDRLSRLDSAQHNSLSALSSLSEACAAVWHDVPELEKANGRFFLFEDRADAWANVLDAMLARGAPLLQRVPQDVVNLIRASRPQEVRDRAWLVIYYSVVLSMVSSTTPDDESTKGKLRCNLWLALNDARLFLEPSESNIQALILVGSHVEEFTTPSLTWMLISNACRMLQALGVNDRRLAAHTVERRIITFWHLNILDSGLALIFGRPPTFHREMVRNMPPPKLKDLLPFKPHVTSSDDSSALFGAHYLHQLALMSRILGDIWNCLYGSSIPEYDTIESTTVELDLWFLQAHAILFATAVAEKPFRDPKSAASIDLGLRTVSFQYNYCIVLLTRSSPQLKERCIDASKKMLHLLKDMVSDSEEVFNGIVWQLVCCPFTPFLTLFGEIISNKRIDSAEKGEMMAAMEQLPVFLGKMSLRNSLAAKVERIAVVLTQHAKSVVRPSESSSSTATPASNVPSEVLPDTWLPTGDMLQWDSFFNTAPVPGQPQASKADVQPNDIATWTSELFGDAFVDWIGWDNQIWETPL